MPQLHRRLPQPRPSRVPGEGSQEGRAGRRRAGREAGEGPGPAGRQGRSRAGREAGRGGEEGGEQVAPHKPARVDEGDLATLAFLSSSWVELRDRLELADLRRASSRKCRLWACTSPGSPFAPHRFRGPVVPTQPAVAPTARWERRGWSVDPRSSQLVWDWVLAAGSVHNLRDGHHHSLRADRRRPLARRPARGRCRGRQLLVGPYRRADTGGRSAAAVEPDGGPARDAQALSYLVANSAMANVQVLRDAGQLERQPSGLDRRRAGSARRAQCTHDPPARVAQDCPGRRSSRAECGFRPIVARPTPRG